MPGAVPRLEVTEQRAVSDVCAPVRLIPTAVGWCVTQVDQRFRCSCELRLQIRLKDGIRRALGEAEGSRIAGNAL